MTDSYFAVESGSELLARLYMYMPPPTSRITPLVSLGCVEAASISPVLAGFELIKSTLIVGARPVTPTPLQSVMLTFNGMVLPSLKMLLLSALTGESSLLLTLYWKDVW